MYLLINGVDLVRAAHAGPALRGQRFANEQILRGPALAALRLALSKGPPQACLQGLLSLRKHETVPASLADPLLH